MVMFFEPGAIVIVATHFINAVKSGLFSKQQLMIFVAVGATVRK
jgi:hypothetical protein